MYQYRAEVLKIVDADTVDILVDLGFSVLTKQRVRLKGLNAPERNTTEGKVALAWLQSRLPLGTTVTIESEKPGGGDKYGRYLAVIVDTIGSINDALISSGHAVVWDGQGNKPV